VRDGRDLLDEVERGVAAEERLRAVNVGGACLLQRVLERRTRADKRSFERDRAVVTALRQPMMTSLRVLVGRVCNLCLSIDGILGRWLVVGLLLVFGFLKRQTR
jgi:hypothetical protein